MRHKWLLGVTREDEVTECEKGKWDKEWREQKWEEGIIYRNSFLKNAESLEAKSCGPALFLLLFLPHPPHQDTQLVPTPLSWSPPNTYLCIQHNRTMQQRGCGVLLLHSYPVVSQSAVISSYRLITTNQIPVNSKKYLFKTKATDWRPCD